MSKLGRNSLCWCNSGKKFKHCHWPDTGPIITEYEFMKSDNVDPKIKKLMKNIDPIMDSIICGKAQIEERYLNKIYYDGIAKRERSWSNPKTCMFPECTAKTIKRSHTIAKSSSIEIIAENKHVLSPLVIEKSDINFKLNPIGINEASTFPGFCVEHESIFNNFENAKKISSEMDLVYQIFRTVCQCLAFKRNELASRQFYKQSYKAEQNAFFIEQLNNHIPGDVSEYGIKNLKLEHKDYTIYSMDMMINLLNSGIQELEDLYEAISKDILNANITGLVFYEGIIFPFQIPVAVAGIANAQWKTRKGKYKDRIIVFNCLPYHNETVIIIAGPTQIYDSVSAYIKYFSQTPLNVLDMVESFMVNGSENWFLKPSVWYKLHPNKKDAILKDTFFSDWKFYEEYPLSIFDDLRMHFIEELTMQNIDPVNTSLKTFLKLQRDKLENIPGKRHESYSDLAYRAVNNYMSKARKSDKGTE